ncbi:hypothetical protein ACFWR9_05610 [Streptomyces sp. NPDC058534]|uniref:hypothetical protein n=1 Tax=Streptomyces sp. NPDC058534 TaxID=3346541 RepID=UPI003655DC45
MTGADVSWGWVLGAGVRRGGACGLVRVTIDGAASSRARFRTAVGMLLAGGPA